LKVLVLVIPLLIGMLVGWAFGKSQARRTDLSRADRKELSARREFMGTLSDKTIEHSMLGDHFAAIVADLLIKYREKNGATHD
jgi:hypothetical protein